jgi:hypothetical protein
MDSQALLRAPHRQPCCGRSRAAFVSRFQISVRYSSSSPPGFFFLLRWKIFLQLLLFCFISSACFFSQRCNWSRSLNHRQPLSGEKTFTVSPRHTISFSKYSAIAIQTENCRHALSTEVGQRRQLILSRPALRLRGKAKREALWTPPRGGRETG